MFACFIRRRAINKASVSVAGLNTCDLDGSLLKVIVSSGGGKSKERSVSSLIEYLTRGTLSLIRRFCYKKACLVVVLE